MSYVYGDIILLENLCMNYIILWSCNRFLKTGCSKLKLFAASLAGAVYALLSCFPDFHYLNTLFMKLMLSLLLVIIAFTPDNLKDFAKFTGVFYLISFIFGGAAFGLYYFISGFSSTVNGISYISQFPVKLLLLAIVIAYLTVRYCWDYIQYRVKRERIITKLLVLLDGRAASLSALVDTGNSLVDPITKSPVVVAEYNAIKELLPVEVRRLFEENSENNLHVLSSIMESSDLVTRFRVIPFRSLGRENGMLIGFKPDEVYITDSETRARLKNIIVGIYNKKLSGSNEYCALVHPDMLSSETKPSKITKVS
ncbi:MAG: sigma-E processing peptidase SpoIIGA [Bacillota bacterium]